MIPRTVRILPIPGGARVVARDWPWAPLCAALLLVPFLPLLVWAAIEGLAIETGGAVVFVALGVWCAALSLRERRDLEIRRSTGGIEVRGTEGAWRWRRDIATTLPADARPLVEDVIATGDDPGAGAVLTLRGGEGSEPLKLAEGYGPHRRRAVEAAARSLTEALR